ncbi:MAG: insulinase family protein [Proteobacteria bacterium]|nr:insulinase family protein [Pseudomonadota bacterium]
MSSVTVSAAPSTRIQEVVSPLGITAWLVEDYTVPLVSMDFAFIGGSARDPDDKAGLSYLTSGLFDEGAGPYDAQAFQEKLDDSAIELGFNSGRDRFEGSLRTLVANLDTAFAMLALALNEPRFDEDAIQRVKAQISAGLKRAETDPDSVVWRALNRRAYAGHPYGRPDKGTLSTLPGITRADIVAAHKARLSRSALRIAAVGAISASDLAKALDRAFGGLPAGVGTDSITDTVMQGAGERLLSTLNVPQSTVAMGRPGLPRHDPDFMAANIANHILGGGSFTSRLWQEVREKRGLAYSVWSQMSTARHAAAFYVGTATSNERVGESISIITAEIEKMAAKGPTVHELKRAQQYLIGAYALRFDTSRKIASHLVEIQIENLGIDYIANRNNLMAAVTEADAKRAARRLLGDGKLLISVAGQPLGYTAS